MNPKEPYKSSYKDSSLFTNESRVDLPQSYTHICCANCNTEIPADNININENIAKCNACNAIFSITEDVKKITISPQKVKQEILRPEGIELFYYDNELEIAMAQPFTWLEFVFIMLFTFVSIPGIVISIAEKTPLPFIILTLIPFVLLIGYFIWMAKRHKVYINVDDHNLYIDRRPRKLIKDKVYRKKDIQQLYIKKNGTYSTVMMIINEGRGQKHVKICTLNSISKGKYIEQEIEALLHIQDTVVPEED